MLEILRDNLAYGLSATNKVVNTRSTLPVLSCVLLEAKDGRVLLSATNLDSSLRLNLGAKVEEDFAVCIPSKELSYLVSARQEDVVKMSYNEDDVSVQLKFGRAKPKVKCMDANEFPLFPETNSFDCQFEIDTDLFLTALNKVVIAIKEDSFKPALSSVRFRFDDTGLSLVGTDGYRMAFETLDVSGGGEYNIPVSTIKLAKQLLAQFKPEKLTVSFDDNRVMFSGDDFIIISQLNTDNYPDTTIFENKLRNSFGKKVVVSTEDLKHTLKTAMVYIDRVKLETDENVLTVSCQSQELGNFSEKIETEGNGYSCLVNTQHLLDILNVTEVTQLMLCQNNSNEPTYIYEVGNNSGYWITMPFVGVD